MLTCHGVAILTGKGNALFSVLTEFSTWPGPKGMVTADFNGDGRPGLAIANANGVTVLINTPAP